MKIPEILQNKGFKEFFTSYVECALWTLQKNVGEIPEDCHTAMEIDCLKFYYDNEELISHDYSQAGHDFWLTRNGHGTGFWDREEIWTVNAEYLSGKAKQFGEFDNLYIILNWEEED